MRQLLSCTFVILSIYLFNFLRAEAGKIEIKCPEFCECDTFKDFRRAVCRNKKLVSIELNIPSQAEILDLSHNQISELGNKIFLDIGLTHLKFLNLSHNKVRQIHFNGFKGLDNLRTLDLSYNGVDYFTKSWFDSLQSLEELYLRGNKLRTINEEALIEIKTLRVLDVSKCGITRLNANTVKMIPNLRTLDISENFIQVIQVDVLKSLPKLLTLKTHDNNFNCKDKRVVEFTNYAKSRILKYTDSCKVSFPQAIVVNQKVHKFEKMVLHEDLEEPKPNVSIKNSWVFDDSVANNTKIVEVCSNNTQNYERNNTVDGGDNGILAHMIQLSPWMTVSIIFIYGLLCGVILSCGISVCARRRKGGVLSSVNLPDSTTHSRIRNIHNIPNSGRSESRRDSNRGSSIIYRTIQRARGQVSRERFYDDDDDEMVVLNQFDIPKSTPVAARKSIPNELAS